MARYIGDDGNLYDDGALSIVGGVGLQMIGQAPVRAPVRPVNPALARRGAPVAPPGVQVRGNAYQDHTQELMLSFPSKVIPAGGSASLTATPQEAIRFQRMVLDQASGTPGQLTVTEIKVGSIPQDVGSGGNAPFVMFSATAINTQLRGKTANIGQTITVTVANSSGADITVSGAITGEALRTA